jgi:cerevisin
MSSKLLQFALLAVSLASFSQATPLSTNHNFQPLSRPSLAVAPLEVSDHPHGTLNNSYIVVFKDDVNPALFQNHLNFLQDAHASDPLVGEDDAFSGLTQVYDSHIKGYAGKFTAKVMDQIRSMPEVAFVEKDQIVKTVETQNGAPWGLARISHRPKLTFGTFTKYLYDPHGGEGVDVYVVDTGINIEHVEFEGRARWGKTIPQNDLDIDGNGHGSHCAGTIASRKYGVAKKAEVIAVKVLGTDGSGSMSDVVGGVAWASGQAKAKADAARAEFKATGKTKHKGSVANMSLGGGLSRALDIAVNKAVDNGLHFAVAAGNDNRDACNYSPAAAEKAITVAASTMADERAYFSNHGPCVDVFAPGLGIKSTYKGGPNAEATLSGTSMASPHTAGLVAYFLSLHHTETFDPLKPAEFLPLLIQNSHQHSIGFSSLYKSAYQVLPSWVTVLLPPPRLLDSIVGESEREWNPISTADMKAGLLALSGKDLIRGELPKGTPNLLIFNNYTSSH